MDFFDYATTHDLARRAGLTNDPHAAFYRELQAARVSGAFPRRARNGGRVQPLRLLIEPLQYGRRPCYKLWPGINALLARVGLNVPVDLHGTRPSGTRCGLAMSTSSV